MLGLGDFRFVFGYSLKVPSRTRCSQLSFRDHRMRTGRGGPRRGAGRRPSKRPIVHHVRRQRWKRPAPANVTLRVVDGLPSLRCKRFLDDLRQSLLRAGKREDFRVVHYSVQHDHLHLVVEADGHEAMGRGMRSLSARISWAVRRVFRVIGSVMAGRYHVRWLKTPTETRNALRYVLLNARKHAAAAGRVSKVGRLDEASSGRWFLGWRGGARGERTGPCEVAPARTWLLRVGWRRGGGLIDPAEVPG